LNTINIHQNYKTFEKKAFHGYNGPLKLWRSDTWL
jgi:hypothetical protein